MAKTYTQLYNADTSAGDNLTLGDIIAFDPAPVLAPSTSKGMTLEQLIAFISANLISQAGTVGFESTVTTVDEGSAVDIQISRADYLAYPASSGSCTITISNELTETTDYTLLLDGQPFSNGALSTWQQYEITKILTFTSLAGTITVDTDVTATLGGFSGFAAGTNTVNTITVVNQ